MSKQLILGMDIGTTSVKVCIIDMESRELVAKQSKDTAANIPSDLGTEGNKQDVPKIVSAVHGCLSRLPKELLRQVVKIGVCGQMHGVLLWSHHTNNKAWEIIEKDGVLVRYEAHRQNVSALYTWQDNRCKKEFLDSLPKPDSHLGCYSGYGCATLLWFAKNKPEKLKNFNRAGTIQDFIVSMICDMDTPVMTTQNAASWGFFNTVTNSWNKELLNKEKFPTDLLANVVESGKIVGSLHKTWHGIPSGTPVGGALGDLQCSVLATLKSNQDAVLNISTSAQLGFVVDEIGERSNTIEYVPYFHGSYLAVAGSLNGGNTLAAFVQMLQQWVMELGFSVPQSKVWEKLILLGKEDKASSSLKISPLLLGERHTPETYASASNINLSNIALGQVFRGLCEGLIDNMYSMMPKDILINATITRILGNGSALSRNVVLQKCVEKFYNLPLEFTTGGDAAKGAAIAVI